MPAACEKPPPASCFMKENLLGRAAKRSQPPAGCFRRVRGMKRGHGCPAGTGGVRGDRDGGCWTLKAAVEACWKTRREGCCATKHSGGSHVPDTVCHTGAALRMLSIHFLRYYPHISSLLFLSLLLLVFSLPTTHRPLTSPGQPRVLETFQTQRLFQT